MSNEKKRIETKTLFPRQEDNGKQNKNRCRTKIVENRKEKEAKQIKCDTSHRMLRWRKELQLTLCRAVQHSSRVRSFMAELHLI